MRATARATTSVTVETDEGPVTCSLRAVEPEAYDGLLSAHPDPTGRWVFHQDTFPPALIAACLTHPRADEFTVATWWETWPADAAESLFVAALQVCAPGSQEWALARLAVDDRFAAEMGYCAPAGLPHSAFLGWSRADQDKALAWTRWRDDRCPGCGVPSRLMDAPGEGIVRQKRCVHCEALAAAEDDIPAEHRRAIHSHVQVLRPGEAVDGW